MGHTDNIRAALLALGSTAILSFVDNFVAATAEEAGLWQFHVVRAMLGIPLLILGARLLRQRARPVNLPAVALRSLVVSLALMIYFGALGVLPVAQAGAGLFSAPIWVMILTALLFRTAVSALQAVAIVAGFGGVLMLLQPDLANLKGLSLLPLAAGAFYAMGMLLTRHRCIGETGITLALGIFVAMGLESLLLLLVMSVGPWGGEGFLTRAWEPLTARFLWLTLLQACGAVVAVSLIAQAYRTGTPHVVAVFEYSFLVFASLWALLLWGQTTGALAWAGIAVITASGLAMAWSQRADAGR